MSEDSTCRYEDPEHVDFDAWIGQARGDDRTAAGRVEEGWAHD